APWFCLIALFLAWGMHILALFLFPVLLILAGSAIFNDRALRFQFFRDWRRPALSSFPVFFALLSFYAWVSNNGVNKTEAQPSFANLAFAFYEFAGLAGLGPPRNDIRENHGLSVFLPYWPLLLLAVAVLVFVLYSSWRNGLTKIARCLLLG